MAEPDDIDHRVEAGTPFGHSIPNAATVGAMEELERGEGEIFVGTTAKLFDKLK
jgi:hypothetical protein